MTAAVLNYSYYNYFSPPRTGASETSQHLAEMLAAIIDHYRTTATNAPFEALRNELLGFVHERSTHNWDDQGATPLSVEAIQESLSFIESLPTWFELPEALPEPDGSVGFEWYKSPDKQFAVSLKGDGQIAYAGKLGNGKRTHGIENFDGPLPTIIREGIRRVSG